VECFVASLEGVTPVQQGWQVVPVEPTPEMIWAGNSLMAGTGTTAAAVWRVMFAAATSVTVAGVNTDQGAKR
jgi:hypothetical protein